LSGADPARGDVRGKTVVITGASSGIGEAAAMELARRGAVVVPVGRDPERLRRATERIGSAAAGEVGEPLQADFASLVQVRRVGRLLLERHARIDVLVNNAGLVAGRRRLTEDGHELTIQVNHLAPFLLTALLEERLRASAPARVITTSSEAHRNGRLDPDDLDGERSWSSWGAYSRSKLANALFTQALARRLEGSGVSATCFHPGVIRSRLASRAGLLSIGWNLARPFFAGPGKGAETLVHLATSADGVEESGAYFVDRRVTATSPRAADYELAERLWAASEAAVEWRSDSEGV
jgi:NAD(P)-dependent dehydrogenase (short-subunit alcohol dehydrogenase family)